MGDVVRDGEARPDLRTITVQFSLDRIAELKAILTSGLGEGTAYLLSFFLLETMESERNLIDNVGFDEYSIDFIEKHTRGKIALEYDPSTKEVTVTPIDDEENTVNTDENKGAADSSKTLSSNEGSEASMP